jgi:hypothetical protein
MEQFLGKWKMISSDNFDEYMEKVGVSYVTRKVAVALKPTYLIAAEPNDVYNLRTESTFKNTDMRFKLNEEFDETTTDGRKCKSVVRLEAGEAGPRLVQDQKGKVDSLIVREIKDNDTLVCTCSALGTTSTRVYQRA